MPNTGAKNNVDAYGIDHHGVGYEDGSGPLKRWTVTMIAK
jgi:hypothetical protein